jgi:hypothetical protein
VRGEAEWHLAAIDAHWFLTVGSRIDGCFAPSDLRTLRLQLGEFDL